MELIVCPIHEVTNAIERWNPSHVVSLASPGAEPFSFPGNEQRLSLVFNDIAEARPGLTLCEADDMARLLAFVANWGGPSPMLVQCWAGISRSPAAAYAIACALTASGREAEWATRLRAAAPFATPNPRVVAVADSLLGRDGRMTKAVHAIGRGAEASCGTAFRLRLDAPA